MRSTGSSLVIGERVVSRCPDGLLEVEYLLFEPDEVIVTAALGFGAREQGYLTTAGLAKTRLIASGITLDLCHDAYTAFKAAHMRLLPRSPSIERVVDELSAYEAFEGGVFGAQTHRYVGAWLDLDAFAQACPLPNAALILQALHLLLVLDESREDVPVRLLTAEAMAEKRPGSRSYAKVRLDGAERLPFVLAAMHLKGPRTHPLTRESGEEALKHELVENLRARSTAATTGRVRLRSLAAMLAAEAAAQAAPVFPSDPPPLPPIPHAPPSERGESATAALKRAPSPRPFPLSPSSRPDAVAIARVKEEEKAQAEKVRSITPYSLNLFEELRSHTEMLRGDGHLRDVAKFLSAMSERSATVPDLAILAARAWLAAGEVGHARHLAKELVASAGTPDSIRLIALEILKSTNQTNESAEPPPVTAIDPMPIVVLAPNENERPPLSGASRPPVVQEVEPPPPSVHAEVVVEAPNPTPGGRPYVQQEAPIRAPSPPPRPPRSEIVETLALPEGLSEQMLAEGSTPRNPAQARIAMVRLSRALGRDYRLWYGTALKTNAVAIETMQRHLRRRFGEGKVDEKSTKKLEIELTRHGALLSEILARSLGATWADVSDPHPGQWSMLLGQSLRVWPIGRVYRFYRQGHREADLVAFYLDLEDKVLRRRE